jgi:acetyl esterase/lipase
MRSISRVLVFLFLAILAGACTKSADSVDRVDALSCETQVISNIEYDKIDSVSLLLDVYVPTKKLGEPPWVEYSEKLKPTLLFFHGGGWTSGDKISRSLQIMPFVDRGWCVVTANYRHLDQTDLINIIGDSRRALHWIYDNADKYKIDTTKIVVAGESAGGHLALMTGFIKDDSSFQPANKRINREMKVAGIINWFGVADLIKTSSTWDKNYYIMVVKDSVNAEQILEKASPVNYITKDSPPVMSIHGDLDISAPYEQSVLLHDLLKQIGVKNYFLTIPGKKHGNFDPAERTRIFDDIWKFLKETGVE